MVPCFLSSFLQLPHRPQEETGGGVGGLIRDLALVSTKRKEGLGFRGLRSRNWRGLNSHVGLAEAASIVATDRQNSTAPVMSCDSPYTVFAANQQQCHESFTVGLLMIQIGSFRLTRRFALQLSQGVQLATH